MAKNKDNGATPKKKNVKARILVAAIALVLVAATVAVVLNLRPAGVGAVIDDEWKTPTYLKEKTMNILVCGIDIDEERKEKEGIEVMMTDVIMLVSLDLENNKASVLQIPRDTYVGDNMVQFGKINGLYNWGYKETYIEEMKDKGIDVYEGVGAGCLIETLHNQLKMPIDNYVMVNMEGFRKAVDIIGGVDITVEETISFNIYDDKGKVVDKVIFEPGTHTLDGELAELFVRYRGYALADIERMNMQRYFMSALLNKLLSTSTMDLASLANAVFPYLETDFTVSEVISLAMEAQSFTADSVEMFRTPGEGVPTYGAAKVDVWTLHKEEMATLLNEHMRPYADDVPAAELDIIEIRNTVDFYGDGGGNLGEYNVVGD